MAVGDYATADQVTAYRQAQNASTLSETLVDTLIPQVSRAIDRYCRRHFYARDEAHRYDFQASRRLMLRGDLISVSSLTNGDGDTIPSDGYILYPLNGPPYGWIDLDTAEGHLFFVSGTPQRALTVAGSWGFLEDDATPQPVQLACVAWINYLVTTGKNAGIQSTTIGDYTESFAQLTTMLADGPPAEARGLLRYYRRMTIGSNVKW